MTIAVVCLLLLSQTPHVAIDSDAIRSGDLVRELSRQTGARLACDEVVADEPLVADFKDRSLDQVLPKIATLVGGEWVENEGVRTLTRSIGLRVRLEREEDERVRDLWARTLAKALDEAAKTPKFDDRAAKRLVDTRWLDESPSASVEIANLSTANPFAIAVVRLLDAYGPVKLAKLQVGERIVFSDAPTRMQILFPPRVRKLADELRRVLGLMQDAKLQMGPGQLTIYGDLPQLGGGNLRQYGKTVIALRKTGLASAAYTITMVDRAGAALLTDSSQFPNYVRSFFGVYKGEGKALDLDDQVRASTKIASDLGYASAGGSTIKLPDGRMASYGFSVSKAESEGKPEDRGLAPILSDPVTHDPVGLFFGPIARQVAARRGEALLATLSDKSLVLLGRDLNRTLKTDGDFMAFLRQTQVDEAARIPVASVEEEDGWLVIQPYFAVAARADRFDRVAAKNFVARVERAGAATLADAMIYVRTAPTERTYGSLDVILMSHAVPSVERASIERVLESPAKFLSELAPGQWKSLESGMPFGSIPAPQRQTIAEWVFWSPSAGRSTPTALDSPLTHEPTEIYPRGIPLEAPVRLVITEEPALIAHSTNGRNYGLTLHSLAFQEGMNGEFPMSDAQRRVYELFRPAVRRDYRIELSLPDGEPATRQTAEYAPAPNTQFVARDHLPQSLRHQMEQAAKDLQGPPPGR